jgi:benzylsuccinate CoA-transferase BbsF subunit
MSKRALEGVKVLEIAYIGITPMTIRLLGMNGATVVRVESRTRLDPLRTSGPFVDGINSLEHSAEIVHVHSDKFGIALNLKNPKAIEVAKRLAAWADIVADGFTTGVLEKLGLGYQALKEVNPDIIMFSCNTFGQTSPMAAFPSTGIQLTGMTGFTEVSGWPDRGPIALGYYSDFIVPHFNLLTLLSALDFRKRTGKGMHIDLAQYEAALYFNAPLVLDYTANKRLGKRHGNSLPGAAPHGVYRCQGDDSWCTIAVTTDQEWRDFCRVIGNPGWTSRDQFSTLLARKQNEDALNRLVQEWTSLHSAKEVMDLLQAAGVSAAAVQTGEEVFKDPQFNHYGFSRYLFYPGIEREIAAEFPFVKLSKTPAEVKMPRPMIGEHNEYICTQILGMSDEEFVDYMAAGAFE